MKNSWLFIGIILFVAVASMMYFAQMPLTNEDVVEMELCFSDVQLLSIYERIGEGAWSMFSTHVVYDFFLMLTYVFLIIQFLLFVQKKHHIVSIKHKVLLVLLAGLLDGIEDVLMYQRISLGNLSIRPEMWSYISCAKFVFIFACIVYILKHLLRRDSVEGRTDCGTSPQ